MEFSGRFPLTLEPARIEWRGPLADEPWAPVFEDIYFSPGQGTEESRAVFLEGNDLQSRARQSDPFAICETGFGTGLNFLLTADLFLSESPGFLHYVSFEKHPLTKPDLERALMRYPASTAKDALIAHYPPLVPGFHTIEISKRILLTLVYGDALLMAPLLRGAFDAFFLDGFAPSRNPDLWSEPLIAQLARMARPEATLATFTAAGSVRRSLEKLGFVVSKVAGFGDKREMIRAVYRGSASAENNRIRPSARRVAVIGAGLAGSACARALSRRGIQAVVFEQNRPASGASGNQYGIFQPVLAAQRTYWSRWTLAGFWYLQSLGLLGSIPHGFGLFQAADSEEEERRLTTALSFAGIGEFLTAEQSSQRLGLPGAGVYFERGGFLSPAAFVEALLRESGADLKPAKVETIQASDEGVHLSTAAQSESFDAAILCCGSDLPAFLDSSALAMDAVFEIVRGQVNILPAGALGIRHVFCHEGYAIPGPDATVIGTTYDRRSRECSVTGDDQTRILDSLERAMPGTTQTVRSQNLPGRASLRIAGTDHLPLFGAVPGLANVYTSAGHGSRGILSAPLAAELIAAEITGGVLPVEADLADFFSKRFAARAQRRQRGARARTQP